MIETGMVWHTKFVVKWHICIFVWLNWVIIAFCRKGYLLLSIWIQRLLVTLWISLLFHIRTIFVCRHLLFLTPFICILQIVFDMNNLFLLLKKILFNISSCLVHFKRCKWNVWFGIIRKISLVSLRPISLKTYRIWLCYTNSRAFRSIKHRM